jgi:hypothetical protein
MNSGFNRRTLRKKAKKLHHKTNWLQRTSIFNLLRFYQPRKRGCLGTINIISEVIANNYHLFQQGQAIAILLRRCSC